MDPTGGILSYVVNKLGDLILSEAALLGNTRRNLEWVHKELGMMQAFLEDAADVQLKEARLKRWIEDIRELAFQTEDVIDTFSIDVGKAIHISFLSSLRAQTKRRHNLGTEIMELRETVAEFSRRKATYDIKIPETINVGNVHWVGALLEKRRLTAAPFVEDRDVVGLDRHVEAVNKRLVHEENRRLAVSILGMGGLGKTTLAKKVYNNCLSSFDCAAWVDVSQKYSNEYILRRIAREILKLSLEDEQKLSQDVIESKLREFLQTKKYMIVLDDVCVGRFAFPAPTGHVCYLPNIIGHPNSVFQELSIPAARTSPSQPKEEEPPTAISAIPPSIPAAAAQGFLGPPSPSSSTRAGERERGRVHARG